MVIKKPVFLSKSSKFHVVWTIWFCSNFTSIWYKLFLRNVWSDFRLPMSALATVAPKSFDGKFTAKFIFQSGILCYHCWYWHWKSKVSSYIIWQVYGPHAGEIWTKSYGPNHTKLCAFWQKWLTIFNKVLSHFGRRFCDWNNCLMLKYQFKDYYLSVFQKLRHPDMHNQVKSCTKHGRPDQSQQKLTVDLVSTEKIRIKTLKSVNYLKIYNTTVDMLLADHCCMYYPVSFKKCKNLSFVAFEKMFGENESLNMPLNATQC